MRRLADLLIGLALVAAATPAAAQMDELPVGVWTGTSRNISPRALAQGAPPQVRQTTLTVRKAADPHWRWRGGPKEITVVSVGGPGFGGAVGLPVSRIQVGAETLEYVFATPDGGDEVTCQLKRQAADKYEGACRGGGMAVAVTLSPPVVDAPPANGMADWQGLRFGTWNGTFRFSEGGGQLATLRVDAPAAAADPARLTFVLNQGPFEARAVKMAGDTLTFTVGQQSPTGSGFGPVTCNLVRQSDGRLEGPCGSMGSGSESLVTLYPPGR